ncbi:hypothetical protein GF377_06600 [candidate division GN15 bacterium]|nr:hypothetical protein [candidate division GN15 bacterium]
MGGKLNCWEFKNCGRGKGGLMAHTLGTCPVAEAMECDGINGGIAAGRVCWTIRSSGNRLCRRGIGDKRTCLACDFYRRVMHEEADAACHRFKSVLKTNSE